VPPVWASARLTSPTVDTSCLWYVSRMNKAKDFLGGSTDRYTEEGASAAGEGEKHELKISTSSIVCPQRLIPRQSQHQQAAQQQPNQQDGEQHARPGFLLSFSHRGILLSGRSMPDAGHAGEHYRGQRARPAVLYVRPLVLCTASSRPSPG
jgi:hypothetical protein